jgi:hypothetical protein
MTSSGSNGDHPTGEGGNPGRVESRVGDNVITIIVDGEGDTTISPAPEHVRRFLEEYRRRHLPPEEPPAAAG